MDYVEVHHDGPVAVVTLNRPERLNALGTILVGEITETFRALHRDRSVRAAVLRGAGQGFCSGADLVGGDPSAPDAEGRGRVGSVYRSQEQLVDMILSIRECDKPVVAAVHGAAVGGGLALALACDLRVATRSARFGSVFIRVGLSSCDVGVSYLLPRIIGATRAAELMLTGRHFSGEDADRWGMLNALVDEGDELPAAMALAGEVAANNEYGVWMTKRGLWANLDAPSLRYALELENRTQVLGTFTGNMAEAAKAFREKRAPSWNPM
jgi:enoyl-CoA hydratase/carnithine racemase